jgi:hypothetical protein
MKRINRMKRIRGRRKERNGGIHFLCHPEPERSGGEGSLFQTLRVSSPDGALSGTVITPEMACFCQENP